MLKSTEDVDKVDILLSFSFNLKYIKDKDVKIRLMGNVMYWHIRQHVLLYSVILS